MAQEVRPARQTVPIKATQIAKNLTFSGQNPFLLKEGPVFSETYGKNRPLRQAMIVGYKGDGEVVIGGERLFVLI